MSHKVRGLPIEIRFLAAPKAYRGKLLSGKTAKGREVHAGCFLRRRLIVLDAALKKQPKELARILSHELFHFAWLRLGNPKRRAFESLVDREIRNRVSGVLGWSAERRKATRSRAARMVRSTRWR